MKKCFECGKTATEQHHIIPQIMGGEKTIPLCSSCHMKVHGINNSARTDNHSENTKRGLDKHRAWELFAVHQAYIYYNAKNAKDVKTILKNKLDYVVTDSKAVRLSERYLEMEENYMQSLFDKEIDSDLSYSWNLNDKEKKEKLKQE